MNNKEVTNQQLQQQIQELKQLINKYIEYKESHIGIYSNLKVVAKDGKIEFRNK